MAAYNFPINPTQGMTYGPWTFDGTAWIGGDTSGSGGGGGEPIDAYTKTESEAIFVNTFGDEMSGNLTIKRAPPSLTLHDTGVGTFGTVMVRSNIPKWMQVVSGNASAYFYLDAYNDAGGFVGHALTGRRADARVSVINDPIDDLGVATKQYVDKLATNFTTFEYMFASAITEPPTGSQVRFNSATYTAVTKVWVSEISSLGKDNSNAFTLIGAGNRLFVQDKDDGTKWVSFDCVGAGVDKGNYYEFPVTWRQSGPSALAEQRIIFNVGSLPGAGGIPEAPTDGVLYSRRGSDKTWQPSPSGSGGAGIDLATADARYVNATGDVMTGNLSLPTGGSASTTTLNFGTAGTGLFGSATQIAAATAAGVRLALDNTQLLSYVPITLPGDPVGALHAATKQYVDAHSSGGGGTATYIGDTPPGSPTVGQLWWESSSGNMYIYFQDIDGAQWVPSNVGAPALWVQMTQLQYDSLPTKDPNTLYVVIG